MDSNNFRGEASPYVGIPYTDIKWVDREGQPFGIASNFNAIIFKDANNIIDVSGAMAIGGDFFSPRGVSIAFGNTPRSGIRDYSPDAVRFLIGGNINVRRSLVVVGHVVGGGSFRSGNGSTYMIGKNGSTSQLQELQNLYQASGGSAYWKPSDKGDHYLISSYDVPRYVPAQRIGADLSAFFQNARASIFDFKQCIENLTENGRIIDNFHEWILRGNNPQQNVFHLDVSRNGLLNKGLRAEVPEGSLVIIKIRSGDHAHLQYGLYGEKRLAQNTLYVFEDAKEIHMELSSDIWGSILAPQAMFHAHQTGGHVSGNVAFDRFAVSANSGFEFHYYPFVGGIQCKPVAQLPEQIPMPISPPSQIAPEVIQSPECPPVAPCPEVVPCPEVTPCPTCPEAQPCPTCPEVAPCPQQQPCPTCPEAQPCPTCPEVAPCPQQQPCPVCPEAVPCPEVAPCPVCPVCPTAQPEKEYIPIPVPVVYKEIECCPEVPDCKVVCDLIMGCIWPNDCCKSYKWEVKLYVLENSYRKLLYCEKIESYGCFKYHVPYKGEYLLCVCPLFRSRRGVRPLVTLNNVGVEKLIVEY